MRVTVTVMKNEAEPRREGVSSQRIRNSSAYRAAMARAAKLLKKPQKLVKLADEGFLKAKKSRPAQLATMLDSLQTLLRLLKAYGNGGYRQLSWSSMVLIVAAIIYFVMPFDLIPDFLLAFGLMMTLPYWPGR